MSTWISACGTSLTFKLRACNNARITLFSTSSGSLQNRSYEIVLGNSNNESSIRELGKNGKSYALKTVGLLDCAKYKQFWIDWADNRIRVGKGLRYGDEFLGLSSNTAKLNSINAFSISTGSGSPGRWEFVHYAGDCNVCCNKIMYIVYYMNNI